MILAFILTMPNNNSWNGQWTGQGNLYARVETLTNSKKNKQKAEELLEKGSWYHNFGDGWGAQVSVKAVTPAEARKLRRDTKGFCGYGWMVNSILDIGKIEFHKKYDRGY